MDGVPVSLDDLDSCHASDIPDSNVAFIVDRDYVWAERDETAEHDETAVSFKSTDERTRDWYFWAPRVIIVCWQ